MKRHKELPASLIGNPSHRLILQKTNLRLLLLSIGMVALLYVCFEPNTSGNTHDRRASNDPCTEAVDRLVVNAKIQLVAFDFDATIIDIHTGGHWKGTSEQLAEHMRPDFQCFITKCLDRGIHVSVATFSTQKELISAVLTSSINHEQANSIPVFGNDDRVDHYDLGKQSQLLLSINYYNQQHAQRSNAITPETTLLVDDDGENIRVAQADNYCTLNYQPDSRPLYKTNVIMPRRHWT